jgi:4-diphosphocytidyl-2-C-methyl-D-erythritol kinase
MITFPPAKINLGLHVVSKRPDGYHNLETCFYPVGWSDILEIIPSGNFEFTTSGIHIPGDPNKNLCVKAYNVLQRDFNLPAVRIHLHKIVPAGAGLGGGSSDAAWTLRMLNLIFDLSITSERLSEYASMLGSDCAFFIYDNAKLGKGRGNELKEIEIPFIKGKFLILVKPDIHVSTAEAYAGVKPIEPKKSLSQILSQPVEEWKNRLLNDFEESVFQKYPEVSRIKDKFYEAGALYSSMSGSGSAVFGIFSESINLRNQFALPEYWSGVLN